MPRNETKRQQKLMKRRGRAKVRRGTMARSASSGALWEKRRILEARSLPIHECLINPGWRESGLAQILISRRQPDGKLVFGVYLVDMLCLGLKNTFCNAGFSVWRYETELRSKTYEHTGFTDCPLALAHAIIYGAIDYAAQFGFRPQEDFELSQYVLADRDDIEPCEGVEFGKDGKPLYVSGPHDNPQRILRQLEAAAGEGNYHYIVGGPA